MQQMVNKKSKKIVMLCSLSIAAVDRFQFEFANGKRCLAGGERINLMMRELLQTSNAHNWGSLWV
jgi:hypothetical protein